MRIHGITLRNYRPFKVLGETILGQLATIVGKNDAGKSCVLRAAQLFLSDKPKVDADDVYDGTPENEDIEIEVSFASLPDTIQLEEGVDTTLRDEMLLDHEGRLRVKKVYPRNDLTKVKFFLVTEDFQDDLFQGLANLKESEIEKRCEKAGIEAKKSGRGITNKSKRENLRNAARGQGIKLGRYELELTPKDDLRKLIGSLLPTFRLFESETSTNIGGSSFQSQFDEIIRMTTDRSDIASAKGALTAAMKDDLQKEFDKISEKLKVHTGDLVSLKVEPSFSWEKAVDLEVYGEDASGVVKPLQRRGSGIRRLLMVAFFEYLAEKESSKSSNTILAVEEPENSLHPGLQRDLARSFRKLADMGYQIIITSHSSIFAGVFPITDLTLIERSSGIAKSTQYPELDKDKIAEELGVEPSDQITGFKACVFVEGKDDVFFWSTVCHKLKEGGLVQETFEEKNIGLIPVGGDNLKHWMSMKAMRKLSRRFATLVDSDLTCKTDQIPQGKLHWKDECEKEGGFMHILRKREIENYLHRNTIARSGRALQQYDDFTNMKKMFGENVYKVVGDMTAEEILEMDKYTENNIEHHELVELVSRLLDLANY
jgi:putative ATP-dependent endonuclease of OLD family